MNNRVEYLSIFTLQHLNDSSNNDTVQLAQFQLSFVAFDSVSISQSFVEYLHKRIPLFTLTHVCIIPLDVCSIASPVVDLIANSWF